jgi:serine/threonine protein kinase
MSRPILPDDDALPPDELARVIAACDRFEAAWKAGRPLRIEDEMAAADEAIRGRLFGELVSLEIELLRRDGRSADMDAYIARFLDREDIVRALFAAEAVTVPYPEATASETREGPASPIEGYELIRQLGAGGQATTYLARDRALKRLVVLKRYHGVGSPGRREAVLAEGRALVRIKSPFVAPCLGVETSGDEIDLVVEYVPGRPLTELTAEERADIRGSARLVENVALGLAEVHACGLLHRDIKPHNIILGDDGVPRLVDFGVAGPMASEALHAIAGSPPYMSPEQARGQGERVDARTDVYGLGAVLYYLFTGEPPHAGASLREILEHAQGAPVAPPRRINPTVPRALDRICLKAMAADPQSRFDSAGALRQALLRYRLARRAAPAFIAVAALLVLLLPAWALWPRPSRPSSESAVRSPASRASAEPKTDPGQAPESGLRVTRFEIPHFPKLNEKSFDPNAAGLLGRKSFTARLDDDVTVQAELSEPAYSFLIAFRPDGTDELCDPEDEDTPPVKKRQPVYPAPAKSDERYRLSEGTGLYAFALVVSREPLPPYRQWKKRVGDAPWAAKQPGEPGVVWRDDGQGPQPLLSDDNAGTRGKGAKAHDSGATTAKLASWLRSVPGVDLVILEAFPVEPAAGR